MVELFNGWLSGLYDNLGLEEQARAIFSQWAALVCALLLSFILYFAVKAVAKRLISPRAESDEVKRVYAKAARRLSLLIPGIAIYALARTLPHLETAVKTVAGIYLSLGAAAALSAFLDVFNANYSKGKPGASQRHSVKGFLRIIKFSAYTVAVVLTAASLMGESPVYVLSALGALSAIILLVFRDAILGLVAGVQMEANDLVRIGDWIDMPKYGADGFVTHISLTVIKVRNFDNTITTVPAYALVSDSFKNWRNMFDSGGRRLKRALRIDAASIGFCPPETLAELKRIHLISGYIDERSKEIRDHNLEHGVDESMPVNGRRLTNIGIFRRYVLEYIKAHPKTRKDMLMFVRQLEPGMEGIPLEIYTFTTETSVTPHEEIVSDIFDHLFAVMPYFGLKLYQHPSGQDIRALAPEVREQAKQ